MKKFLFILIFICSCQNAFAFNIVYPKKNEVTINSPSTFFIGSAKHKDKFTINGESVNIHHSGGFAYVVPLKEGKNEFVISDGKDTKTYVITRPIAVSGGVYTPPKLVEYEGEKQFLTVVDNAPLRTSPIDSGINRMSHFEKDIPLTVDGEKSSFYRVVLGKNKKAWISKNNVKAFDGYSNSLALVSGYDYLDSPDYFTFVFHLDKKVPFEIVEGETFYLKFYNVKDCADNTYVFEFPYAEAAGTKKIVGYSGRFDGYDFIFKVRKFPKTDEKSPLKDIKIAVDAGHGGKESGAIGCCGDKEKDITLAISRYLKEELQRRGAKVIMTRNDDSYVDLKERVDIANENDAMFLISIHGNALPDNADPNKHRGTSIYFYYNQAKLLAANVLISMNKQLGTQNDNIRQGSLALVRNTNALSILIEVAYLINPEDNAMLIDTKFQKKCAKAIADGLEEFFKN